MAVGSTTKSSIRMVREVTPGTTPASGEVYLANYTNSSLGLQASSISSNTIRDDRNVAGSVRTQLTAAGDLGFELQYDGTPNYATPAEPWGYINECIHSALGNDTETGAWTGPVDCVATNAAKTITSVTGGFTANLAAGDLVRFANGTPATADGYYYVVSVDSDTTITVEAPANFAGETGGDLFRGTRLIVGNTVISDTIEIGATDISEYELLRGMRVDQLSMEVATGAAITCTARFAGIDSDGGSASETLNTGGGFTENAAPTTPVMNTIENVPRIFIGGTPFAATRISAQISNNITQDYQVGSAAAAAVNVGNAVISGSAEALFQDQAAYSLFVSGAETTAWFVTVDESGQGYGWVFPSIRLQGDGSKAIRGPGQSIILQFTWEAFLNQAQSTSARIMRFE